MTDQNQESTTLSNAISGSVDLTFTLPPDDNYLQSDQAVPVELLPASALAVRAGAVLAWAGSAAPDGWKLCDGAAVSRTDFEDLFSVIGETFGAGDGSTTFNLPDLRGRFPLGLDNMGGTSADSVTVTAADALAGVGGSETHALTVDEIPAHNHGFRRVGSGNTGARAIQTRSNSDWENNDVIIDDAGGGQAHDNLPPFLSLNYIIKT
ncbi:MAG: tail fiber protein [Anaerolineaceae bacterium]|nr:tail fiber protein [Anaerolineaceae bacterium]